MAEAKFEKGMKVKCTSDKDHIAFPQFYPSVGTVGTVVEISFDGDVLVKWPEGATSGDDHWWISPDHIKPVGKKQLPKIVIYHDKCDPRLVIAKDLGSGKTGVAKCNPEDVFNFYTGAGLAMGRLAREMGAPIVTDVVGKKAEPKCKFKVGDIIVGNKNANKYGITKQGWIGRVCEVYPEKIDGRACDEGKDIWFRAETINTEYPFTFALDQDAFDLA